MMLAVVLLVSLFPLVQSQLNPIFTKRPNNSNPGTSTGNTFYLSSNSDCNGPVRELFASTATIKGYDTSPTRQGPTTCTIRLRSTGQFDSTVLDIEVKSMNIQDCNTQVSLYDGDGAQQLLMSYDCRSSQNPNRRRFITRGDTATFMMSRQNAMNVNFDIEIIINPIRGGIDPDSSNSFGSAYYFDKFPQMAIVGIIGAFYAVILVICTVIIIYCRRNYWGLNKEWETHQLAAVKTGTTFDTKSQPSTVWSVEMKQRQGSTNQYSYGTTFPNPRKNVSPHEDGESGVFYNDDAFQKRRLMKDEKDNARPRYVSSNTSFDGLEENRDHLKKTITPQVTSGNKRNKQPPLYKDVVSNDTSDHSSDNESEVSSSDASVQKRSLSSEDERSERSRTSKSDTPSDTETEEDSGSEDDYSNRGHRAKARKHRKITQKNKQKGSENGDGPSRSSRSHQQSLPLAQIQQVPYGAYQSAHFVPVMAGPPHYQSVVPMVPTFPPPTNSQMVQQIQPTEPPIYSYLVRRGYTPVEAPTTSMASVSTDGSKLQTAEVRLDSGVEYMRR